MKRLGYGWANELDSLKYDNEKIYDQVTNDISSIEDLLNKINLEIADVDENTSFESLEDNNLNLIHTNVMTHVSYVSSEASEIISIIGDAKDNGITNEDTLRKGRKIIDELEKEIEDLKEQIEEISGDNSNLQDEVNSLLSQIENIQNEIDNIQSSTEALSNNGMEKEAGHAFICYAHDAITQNAKNIMDACNDFEFNYISNVNEFIDEITDNLSGIKSDMDEAREMNERMGNGIDEKNTRIDDLRDEISDIEDELKRGHEDKDEFEYQLRDLQTTLSELEDELSNYGG